MTNIEELKNFLREHKKELKEKDLNTIYYDLSFNNKFTDLGFEDVPELTKFFLDHGIDPLKYLKESIPLGFASMLSVYNRLKIPEGIRIIHDNAFDSSDITSLYIPDTVEEIGYRAFANCENLKSVYIDGCPLIWETTFKDDSNLEKVVFNCSANEFEEKNFDSAILYFNDNCKITFKR